VSVAAVANFIREVSLKKYVFGLPARGVRDWASNSTW
jgi:hypothetical protein